MPSERRPRRLAGLGRAVVSLLGAALFVAASVANAGPLLGDTNCDGHIDGADGLPPLLHAAGVQLTHVAGTCPAIGSDSPPFGDVNCDSVVDELDVIAILQYAAELPINPPQPGGCTPLGTALP